jgi:hypothetical protein
MKTGGNDYGMFSCTDNGSNHHDRCKKDRSVEGDSAR